MRVPFIAAWITPNDNASNQVKLPIAQHAVQEQLGSILDIFPTLSHLTNTKQPEGYKLDGFELFLNHFPHGDHRSNYFTTLVNSDWKIIYHYQPKSQPRYELFNLKEDPYETNDLSDTNPNQLITMMTLLSEEMARKKALYPEKGDHEIQLVIPE